MDVKTLTVAIILTSCTIGPIAHTPTPPVATPWPTNTPSATATYTLTAVNISPTPDTTPTAETLCVPGSYVTVLEDTPLYDQSDMQRVAMVSYTSEDGTFHFEQAILLAGESALLLFDRTDSAWRVIAAEGSPRLGWLALPVECR